MPTVLSMCHGGIWRPPTRCAIDFTHGRASSYVCSDMGAMLAGRWQASHFAWKIGAMSLVNVGVFAASAARAEPDRTRTAPTVSALNDLTMPTPFDDRRLYIWIGDPKQRSREFNRDLPGPQSPFDCFRPLLIVTSRDNGVS